MSFIYHFKATSAVFSSTIKKHSVMLMQITCGFAAGAVVGQKSRMLDVNNRQAATTGPGRSVSSKLEWTPPVKLSGQRGCLHSGNGCHTQHNMTLNLGHKKMTNGAGQILSLLRNKT